MRTARMMNIQCTEHDDHEIPSYLVPDPDDGAMITAWIASIYAFTNVSMFCETTTADMMTVRQMMAPQSDIGGNCPLLNYALGMEVGPCAFLTMLPVLTGQPQYVSVIHGLRQGSSRKEVYSFIGDTSPPTLPTIKMEPNEGLVHYLQPSYKTYCDSSMVNSFYETHSDDNLLPNEGQRIRRKVRSLVYIPTVWVLAFAAPLLPNEARKRVIELCQMMPQSSQYLFEEIIDWTTAACTELGAVTSDSGMSLLTIPWRDVPIEHTFLLWAEHELVRLYPNRSQLQKNIKD
jgi:hypothetical protein